MKILVIEDEKKIRDFLKHNLQNEQYVVDTASDGSQGLKLMRLYEYNLVILDNVLPEKSGEEVCREARSFGVMTPIIMLSVMGDPQIKAKLLDLGADDYLSKPFSFKELKSRMKAVLRRPVQIAETVLEVGNITLNTRTQDVTYKGKKIKLTRKEYLLLHYFMSHVGTVVTRGTLLEHVWDMNADPFSNTLEAHVGSLRKKIHDKKRTFIETIPRRGYKCNGE